MQWVKPRPCPFRFKYYVFYTKNTKKVMPLISGAAFWIQQEKSQKSSSHYYPSYDMKKEWSTR